MPVIIGASFHKCLRSMPGKYDIKELQQIVTMGTEHVVGRVPMSEYKMFNVGNSFKCAMNCNYSIAATVYTLETWNT
jgi:hypothetical protein